MHEELKPDHVSTDPLVVRIEPACWIHISGDIDASNAHQLAEALDQVMPIIVDCSEVTFMDSSAFGVLVDAYRVAVKNGRPLRITSVSGTPLRAMQLLQLEYLTTGDAGPRG